MQIQKHRLIGLKPSRRGENQGRSSRGKSKPPYTRPGQPTKTLQRSLPKQKRILYILDTNVVIDDPLAPFAFQEHDVIIPVVVLEELDKLKGKLPQAREAIRELYGINLSGSWIQLQSGGRIRAETGEEHQNLSGLAISNDNRIIAVAHGFTKKFDPSSNVESVYKEVVLVTNDLNMGTKARVYGIKTELYKTTEVLEIGGESDVLPKLIMSGQELQKLYTNSHELRLTQKVQKWIDQVGLVENAGFIICLDDVRSTHQFACVYKRGKLIRVDGTNHSVYANGFVKPFVPTYYKGEIDHNHEQEIYLENLFDPNVVLLSVYGKAGTGKTLMAVSAGLKEVLEGRYKKLLITKPNIASGNEIGFLPGTKEQKMASWIAPLRDHILAKLKEVKRKKSEVSAEPNPSDQSAGKKRGGQRKAKETSAQPAERPQNDNEIFDELIASGLIEVEATMYVRGRSLEGVFTIIDEGQNLSVAEMKTWVTRIGEGSKLVVTGDIEQIDNPYLRKNNNGLAVIAERSKGQPWAASSYLRYGVRSIISDWAAQNI